MRPFVTFNDVHQQFATYFDPASIRPFAYLLSRKLSEGHICLDLDDISSMEAYLPAGWTLPSDIYGALQKIPIIGWEENAYQPFIVDKGKLYLQRYFKYEQQVYRKLKSIIHHEQQLRAQRTQELSALRDFIRQLFPPNNPVLSIDWQLIAALTAVLNNFTIITGGPGTGKTTTVAKLLAILYTLNPGLKVALAAPTGKAAARMAESLRKNPASGLPRVAEKFQELVPSTIHRLLRSIHGSPYFKYNAENPLPYDVIIVDESSMIDVALFSKLLDAVGAGSRLIMLGDKNQLASVEAGSMFGDICQSLPGINTFDDAMKGFLEQFTAASLPLTAATGDQNLLFQHIIELQFSHRFKDTSGIGRLSKAIINNDPAVIEAFTGQADPGVLFDTGSDKKIFNEFIDGYRGFIQTPGIHGALSKLNQLRVLVAVREGDQGLYQVNQAIEDYLSAEKLLHIHQVFYENRPIMLTKNYYEHGLFNGDTGIIRSDEEGTMKAWFDDGNGGLISVLPGYLSDSETAFAMTIHKSQGSEFNKVLVLVPAREETPILTRELLYTAVSRAKQQVVLQGSMKNILMAASRKVERASGIARRLQENN
ncbi:exodeoxyribonuclease V subunit alpha [Chitinophaga caeni]|uniref:RecBCD enzyme subunit RecD n=1 Tax=Chitinophaga caeni TaxID=2029983 RepID=A0A291QYY6_9BACT|nr:exodeoxyribonuclease V subunit alpha [Chitinophaga caeni]ATL49170.1 exodeoxyribonuclease V subunit alpha [Chitinophaga caeni]